MRVCKTTDTRRRLPILPTLIHRDDESYFPTTIWRILGCVRRFIARRDSILLFFREDFVPEDELYSL